MNYSIENQRPSISLLNSNDGRPDTVPPVSVSGRIEVDIAPTALFKVGAALAAVWLVAKIWPVLVRTAAPTS